MLSHSPDPSRPWLGPGPAGHEPDKAKSNTTAGLWSENSAGRIPGLPAQWGLLQVSRLGNQGALLLGHAGGPFMQVRILEQCLITLELIAHYNQS